MIYKKFKNYKGIPKVSMIVYTLIWIAVNVVIGPKMKELQIPIMVYSFFLALMAAISSGVSTKLGAGGFIFALSDLLISFGEAKMDFAYRDEIVSFTYVVA
jgi:uncharacterized membrane protein YhhN